jgi:hypothetical protein
VGGFSCRSREFNQKQSNASEKEAAIQQMVVWFASTQGGQRPSRSAVFEKLTPFYRRFFSDEN